MAALATVEELRDFLDDQEVPDARGNLMLAGASGLVRSYTGQLFDLVDGDVALIDGSGTRALLLPQVPVTDVTAVVEDPRGAAKALAEGSDFEWSEDGILRSLGAPFVLRFRWYQVTYSHGYATVPDGLKGIVLRVAARGVTNPEGLGQETIGRYAWTAGGEAAGLGLYAADLRELDNFKP